MLRTTSRQPVVEIPSSHPASKPASVIHDHQRDSTTDIEPDSFPDHQPSGLPDIYHVCCNDSSQHVIDTLEHLSEPDTGNIQHENLPTSYKKERSPTLDVACCSGHDTNHPVLQGKQHEDCTSCTKKSAPKLIKPPAVVAASHAITKELRGSAKELRGSAKVKDKHTSLKKRREIATLLGDFIEEIASEFDDEDIVDVLDMFAIFYSLGATKTDKERAEEKARRLSRHRRVFSGRV